MVRTNLQSCSYFLVSISQLVRLGLVSSLLSATCILHFYTDCIHIPHLFIFWQAIFINPASLTKNTNNYQANEASQHSILQFVSRPHPTHSVASYMKELQNPVFKIDKNEVVLGVASLLCVCILQSTSLRVWGSCQQLLRIFHSNSPDQQ